MSLLLPAILAQLRDPLEAAAHHHQYSRGDDGATSAASSLHNRAAKWANGPNRTKKQNSPQMKGPKHPQSSSTNLQAITTVGNRVKIHQQNNRVIDRNSEKKNQRRTLKICKEFILRPRLGRLSAAPDPLRIIL